MHQGNVGVVVTCMDCRLHAEEQRMHSKLCEALSVDRVYVRTAAGPDGKILFGNHHCDSIVEDVALIIEAKGAHVVGVVAHYDCAGHPVTDEQHHTDVVRASELLTQKLQKNITVVPLIAALNGSEWYIKPGGVK